jgi:TonB family protein
MSRKWLVSVSIVGHLAVGVGLFASGVWELEKLESDHRMAGIGIMVPTASGGGQQDLPEHKFVKKEKAEKKVVKDVQWDKRVDRDDKPKVAETKAEEPGDGEGEGPGIGSGKGPGDQLGDDNGDCAIPPCDGIAKLPDPPKPPAPPPVVNVSPTIMRALRISGETQIHPSRTVKNQILADGKTQVVGTLKVCIQASGAIGAVAVLGSTKYPEYDGQLLEAARRWHYRPHVVNGVATPACSAVSFVYSIK